MFPLPISRCVFFSLFSSRQFSGKNALRNWEQYLICGCICACDWVRAHFMNVYYLFRKCKSLVAGVNERENFQNHFHTINTGNCAVHHTTAYSAFDIVTAIAVYISIWVPFWMAIINTWHYGFTCGISMNKIVYIYVTATFLPSIYALLAIAVTVSRCSSSFPHLTVLCISVKTVASDMVKRWWFLWAFNIESDHIITNQQM